MWLAVAVGYVGAVAWAYPRLPDPMATHWDFAGTADGWMSRGSHLIFSGLLGVGVIVGLPLLSSVLARGSGAFVNVPHKDYWLDPQHPQRRTEFWRRFTDDMYVIAALTGGLLIWMQIEMVLANRREPPDMAWWSWLPLGIFIAAIISWSLYLAFWRYRPPQDEPGSTGQGPILPV